MEQTISTAKLFGTPTDKDYNSGLHPSQRAANQS